MPGINPVIRKLVAGSPENLVRLLCAVRVLNVDPSIHYIVAIRNGLQPNSDGLQPNSDGPQPSSNACGDS